jgi:hypothetical protein
MWSSATATTPAAREIGVAISRVVSTVVHWIGWTLALGRVSS